MAIAVRFENQVISERRDSVEMEKILRRPLFVTSSAARNLRSLTFVRDNNSTFGDYDTVSEEKESNRMRKFVTLSLVPAAALALGNFVFAQESFFKGKVEGSKQMVDHFEVMLRQG